MVTGRNSQVCRKAEHTRHVDRPREREKESAMSDLEKIAREVTIGPRMVRKDTFLLLRIRSMCCRAQDTEVCTCAGEDLPSATGGKGEHVVGGLSPQNIFETVSSHTSTSA